MFSSKPNKPPAINWLKRYSSTLPIIGLPKVGKSQLIARFQKKDFKQRRKLPYQPTPPTVHVCHKHDNILFEFYLAQREPREIYTQDVNKVKGMVIMFDLTKKSNFLETRRVLEKIRMMVQIKDKIVMLVGAKSDLGKKRQQRARERGEELAREFGVEYMEISSKTEGSAEGLITRLIERFDNE